MLRSDTLCACSSAVFGKEIRGEKGRGQAQTPEGPWSIVGFKCFKGDPMSRQGTMNSTINMYKEPSCRGNYGYVQTGIANLIFLSIRMESDWSSQISMNQI